VDGGGNPCRRRKKKKNDFVSGGPGRFLSYDEETKKKPALSKNLRGGRKGKTLQFREGKSQAGSRCGRVKGVAKLIVRKKKTPYRRGEKDVTSDVAYRRKSLSREGRKMRSQEGEGLGIGSEKKKRIVIFSRRRGKAAIFQLTFSGKKVVCARNKEKPFLKMSVEKGNKGGGGGEEIP